MHRGLQTNLSAGVYIMKLIYHCRQSLLALLLCMVFAAPSQAFSILAHEAIIDASWTDHIRPLLQKKYPQASADELQKAQAYAYGGSLVADMGYMPFGCPYFTDLLHYVRSGDFVMALVNESQNINEYAFALGAISHYMADKYGHELATNLSIAMAYPKLKQQFGKVITYDNDHTSHSRMEFAFDVIQTVKGNYASIAYHNFIGFNIATPVLRRAFLKTYGQDLNTIFPDFESAIATFRWGVRDFFPELARTAWRSDKAGIRLSNSNIKRKTFTYRMPQHAFDKQFGDHSNQAGLAARSVVHAINTLPKIGPLKTMRFKYPGTECEKLYLSSMDSILLNYGNALQQAGCNNLKLPNIDFDTGKPAVLNEYALADKTYNNWLLKLQADKNARIDFALQQNVLAFYCKASPENLAGADSLKNIIEQLQKIKTLAAN